jgi:hypothetical protein
VRAGGTDVAPTQGRQAWGGVGAPHAKGKLACWSLLKCGRRDVGSCGADGQGLTSVTEIHFDPDLTVRHVTNLLLPLERVA